MKLVAKNVSYKYTEHSRPSLNDISLEIASGSYWCLAGPNGSGKSTFLKLMCGLLPFRHFRGELTWDGIPIQTWTRLELARRLAFVPGNLKTLFPVTVEEFVVQGRYAKSRFFSRASAKDFSTASRAIDQVGIASLRGALVTELSAGESQLAMIARALAQEPQVLVLDESTSNLDLAYQARIFGLISELNKQGVTTIVVSHDLNLAAEFCPNAIWLHQANLHSKGAMADTLNSKLMHDLYSAENKIEIGTNPFTGRPKLFWR